MVGALRDSGRVNPYKGVAAYNTCVLGWESDVLVLAPSGFMTEYEIKVSVADFMHDAVKYEKHLTLVNGAMPKWKGGRFGDPREWDWTRTVPHPLRRFYYAVPIDIATRCQKSLPAHAGLVSVSVVFGKRRAQVHVEEVKRAPLLKHARTANPQEREALYKTMYYKAWRQRAITWKRRRSTYVQMTLPGMEEA